MNTTNGKKSRFLHPSFWGLICLSIAVVLIGIIAANPLRHPESWIRNRALKQYPMGSSRWDLAAVAKSKGWDIEVELQTGNAPEKIPLADGTTREAPLNGEYLSRVNMGHYMWIPVPFRVDVESYWIFNPKGQLVELYVKKEADLL
jgi:hypothetical protein